LKTNYKVIKKLFGFYFDKFEIKQLAPSFSAVCEFGIKT
jgi:hypothetical protein